MIPFITRRIFPKLRWKMLYGVKNTGSFCIINRKYNLHKKNLSHNLSFDDIRLQKHLEFLNELYTKADGNRNNLDVNAGFSYEMLGYIQALIHEITTKKLEIYELDVLINDVKDKENELLKAALSEMEVFKSKLDALQHKVFGCVVPAEPEDEKDVVLEVVPGVGGQEAMLFAKDIFHMYCHYAAWKGWQHEVLKYDATDLGGIRMGHIGISGPYRVLKYECGVHRVQRVPRTEKAGRIHTSTTTVAVLPQPTEIDIVIKPGDIELEFKRSSGAGGQHVNTTDSCVRIYHKPSGIVTESQVARDQHRNRAIAMTSLRAKLYERELMATKNQTTSERKSQVGSAARSEKVRTYNFVQDRVTDHRAHITMHGTEEFMRGEGHFDRMAHSLQQWHHTQALLHILNKYDST